MFSFQVLFCCFIAAQNIAMLNPHLEIFSTARGAAKSLFGLLERESKINALNDSGLKPEAFKGDIVFDNLYFNYPSRPDVKVRRRSYFVKNLISWYVICMIDMVVVGSLVL